MDVHAVEAEISSLTEQITELNLRRAKLLEQQALENTNLRVGMRVKLADRPEVWEVVKIAPGYSAKNPRIYGRKIKKDGEPSLSVNEISWKAFNNGREWVIVREAPEFEAASSVHAVD
jgi:uncharacterized OB-fold protein